jgi:hypothetical protein
MQLPFIYGIQSENNIPWAINRTAAWRLWRWRRNARNGAARRNPRGHFVLENHPVPVTAAGCVVFGGYRPNLTPTLRAGGSKSFTKTRYSPDVFSKMDSTAA